MGRQAGKDSLWARLESNELKVLLDHCVPRPFERQLPEHEVKHTSRLGWQHLENGLLLRTAEADGFDALVTVDTNMPFQQNMGGRTISLIILKCKSNALQELRPLVGAIEEALKELEPGSIVIIHGT